MSIFPKMPLLSLEWIIFLCNLLLNKNLASKVKCESNKCNFQDFLQNQRAYALTGGSVFIQVVSSPERTPVLLEIPEQYDTSFDFLNVGPLS